ncbi:MAG: right-handed parallel beta-helix repeat-containing protein [Planctomycetota bacterium]|jgi:predicted outer membrane repeat protein
MKLSVNSYCTVVVLLIVNSAVLAADRLVPSQYPTIQAATDAAVDGDTIVVAQDTYYENINVGGKSITLTSSDPNDPNVVAGTIIDANGSGTVVTFADDPSTDCILAGFTITGGNTSGNGGGILAHNGTIGINNCIITGNSASSGGGIYNDNVDLTLIGCTFTANQAAFYGGGIQNQTGLLILTDCTFSENMALGQHGGGIYSVDGPLTLTGCTFTGNSAANEGGGIAADYKTVTLTGCTFISNSANLGGGINNAHWGGTMTNCTFSLNSATNGGGIHTNYLHLGDLTLINCTFSDNIADEYGGAVHNRSGGNVTLTNSILWDNTATEGPQISLKLSGTLSIRYCCLQGGLADLHVPFGFVDWHSSNIDTDPCFADAGGSDCHLRSTAGRWDANTKGWVKDDSNSPCIDAGDPSSDWTAELWPHGKRINMGAFGGTAQASLCTSTAGNIADFDGSDGVDGADLRPFTDKWLYQQVLLAEDLDRDGLVSGGDFAVFADNWAWKQ